MSEMLKYCRYNKHRKPFSYRQQLTVRYNSLKSPEMLSGELKCSLFVLQVLRRLDWIFLGGYLPSLSINYVGMSKDTEKKLPQLYYIKMKISYDMGFIAIGVAMTT